jgi:hypothetical protein
MVSKLGTGPAGIVGADKQRDVPSDIAPRCPGCIWGLKDIGRAHILPHGLGENRFVW